MGVGKMGPPQQVTLFLSLFLLSGTAWACKSKKTDMWRNGSGPSGQMTSPNFTTGKFFFSRSGAAPYGKYPNSFHESKTIKVDKGHLVKIRFTDFDLAWTGRLDLNPTSHEWIVNHTPVADYVEITDGDGTFLGNSDHSTSQTMVKPFPMETWIHRGWGLRGSSYR